MKQNTRDLLEIAQYCIPGWNLYILFRARREQLEADKAFKQQQREIARFGALLEQQYIPFKYRAIEGYEEQVKAIVEDILGNVPYAEIFSVEVAQGFTEEQIRIMDETEAQYAEASRG